MSRRTIVVMVFLISAGALFAAGSSGGTGGGSTGGGMPGGAGGARGGAKTALDWYNAGYAASESKNYAEAITDFTSALEVNANYAEAYNMLGFCTRKMGNVAKAFTYYETALRLKPNFPEAREYYGEAYLQSGNLAKAVQQYIILARAHSKNADELLDQIDLYVNQKG